MQNALTIFLTVFLAELGDKTQLATLLYATDAKQHSWCVFTTAAAALVSSTAVAVLLGVAAEEHLAAMPLKLIAGIGFILIGGTSTRAERRPGGSCRCRMRPGRD